MLTSLPYPGEPLRAPDDDQFTERLRGLTPQQLLDAMTHYRGEGLNDLELYEPGHAPEVTWRASAPARTPALPAPSAR